jgi:hypothetical protein
VAEILRVELLPVLGGELDRLELPAGDRRDGHHARVARLAEDLEEDHGVRREIQFLAGRDARRPCSLAGLQERPCFVTSGGDH